jgi:hypothetical protein
MAASFRAIVAVQASLDFRMQRGRGEVYWDTRDRSSILPDRLQVELGGFRA